MDVGYMLQPNERGESGDWQRAVHVQEGKECKDLKGTIIQGDMKSSDFEGERQSSCHHDSDLYFPQNPMCGTHAAATRWLYWIECGSCVCY